MGYRTPTFEYVKVGYYGGLISSYDIVRHININNVYKIETQKIKNIN